MTTTEITRLLVNKRAAVNISLVLLWNCIIGRVTKQIISFGAMNE